MLDRICWRNCNRVREIICRTSAHLYIAAKPISINYAQEHNYNLIWLTVWEKNMRALKLYQQFGFAIVGEEEFVLGQDVQRDYIMEKIL